jgi:hypothetical protein
LLTLLWRTGQRISDWSDDHGRHGVLGMRLGDLDRASSTIVVCLKGARDEHRVPVLARQRPRVNQLLLADQPDPHARRHPGRERQRRRRRNHRRERLERVHWRPHETGLTLAVERAGELIGDASLALVSGAAPWGSARRWGGAVGRLG